MDLFFVYSFKNKTKNKLLLPNSTGPPIAKCLLSDDIYDYYNVSQGKITIPSMDDGEESTLTDVSERFYHQRISSATPL